MCEAERRGLRFLFKIRRTKTVLSLFRRMENDRDWELIILAAFRKWIGGKRAKGLLPKPLAVIA